MPLWAGDERRWDLVRVIYYLRRDKETKTNLHSHSVKLSQSRLAKQDEREGDRNVGVSTLTLIHKFIKAASGVSK